MLVWHFSRLIRLMATFSLRGMQRAAWTTAVAPLPAGEKGRAEAGRREHAALPRTRARNRIRHGERQRATFSK